LDYIEGSVDYLGWRTENGQCKSTNHLNDILLLTENGKYQVQQICNGEENDLQVWQWVMLSEVDIDYPVHIIIKDLIIKSCKADKHTSKEIKSKILVLHNDNLHTQSQIGPWTTVHELVTCILKQK
ncbi:22129_t:CDS:2, partial [Gigaspora margarita]